jgi:hypothetical protein
MIQGADHRPLTRTNHRPVEFDDEVICQYAGFHSQMIFKHTPSTRAITPLAESARG